MSSVTSKLYFYFISLCRNLSIWVFFFESSIMAELKIFTLNINGLRSAERINYLKNFIISNSIDILCLQETHIDNFSSAKNIEQCLNPQVSSFKRIIVKLLLFNYDIFLSDIRTNYCLELDNKFNEFENFLGTEIINLTDPNFDKKYANHLQKYDTVFALNVVEHIHDDTLALKNCNKLLTKNGHVIILVPSYQKLFNQFDTELGHYRRYNKTSLSNIFSKSSFELIHKQYFNFIGIFGWYISGAVLKKKTIPRGQMKLYNTLIPIIKIIDKLIFNAMGLSTIIVGKKTL